MTFHMLVPKLSATKASFADLYSDIVVHNACDYWAMRYLAETKVDSCRILRNVDYWVTVFGVRCDNRRGSRCCWGGGQLLSYCKRQLKFSAPSHHRWQLLGTARERRKSLGSLQAMFTLTGDHPRPSISPRMIVIVNQKRTSWNQSLRHHPDCFQKKMIDNYQKITAMFAALAEC